VGDNNGEGSKQRRDERGGTSCSSGQTLIIRRSVIFRINSGDEKDRAAGKEQRRQEFFDRMEKRIAK